MMRVTTKAQSGTTYISPFINGHADPIQVPVDVTAMTSKEVTDDGFLKPGVIIGKAAADDGALIGVGTGGAGLAVIGATIELAKVAESNSANDLTAAGTVAVAIGTRGILNRALIEEMLDRALTADEVAACRVATSALILHE